MCAANLFVMHILREQKSRLFLDHSQLQSQLPLTRLLPNE